MYHIQDGIEFHFKQHICMMAVVYNGPAHSVLKTVFAQVQAAYNRLKITEFLHFIIWNDIKTHSISAISFMRWKTQRNSHFWFSTTKKNKLQKSVAHQTSLLLISFWRICNRWSNTSEPFNQTLIYPEAFCSLKGHE